MQSIDMSSNSILGDRAVKCLSLGSVKSEQKAKYVGVGGMEEWGVYANTLSVSEIFLMVEEKHEFSNANRNK